MSVKNAIIHSVFKSGNNLDPSNYRPISILTIFSKILEKLFYSRLFSFIDKHHILHPNQFGFQPKKSTSLAVANVLSTLINKINTNKHVALILFDLRKAFDLINHKLLIKKLQHYGIRGIASEWLASYLANRMQKVKSNGLLSDLKYINTGVPQGSILAPLLFIIFVNDIFQLTSENYDIFLYADDTAVIISCKDSHQFQRLIDSFTTNYLLWCNNNGIMINPNKSEYLKFRMEDISININGSYIK